MIVYGHDSGLRILWRGGKRRKKQEDPPSAAVPRANGSAPSEAIVLDDDHDDDEIAPSQQLRQQVDHAFEPDEDELDPDRPYPGIIQAVDVDLGAEVLHLAQPTLPQARSLGSQLGSHAFIAIACGDGRQILFSLPLLPPSADDAAQYAEDLRDNCIELQATKSVCHGLALKFTAHSTNTGTGNGNENENEQAVGSLLVAAVSEKLTVWEVSISGGRLGAPPADAIVSIDLPHTANKAVFHPSATCTQLLIVDDTGTVRIYDPLGQTNQSGDDAVPQPAGLWIMNFQTSFTSGSLSQPRRKHILDAAYILSGKAILVLLEDSEWGIWDLQGTSQTNGDVTRFVLHGFLGTSAVPDSIDPTKQKKAASKFAPMTPNTRKSKAETLFAGPTKTSSSRDQGGISVTPTTAHNVRTDESVVMWYNSDIYSIPSVQAFWQRSMSNSSGSGFGSLYSPSLTHITDANLMNEYITSISQFATSSSTSSLGQMNTQRDLLISAEYHLLMLQSVRLARALFQQAAQRPSSRDQKMLDAGDLDVGGLDRMMDSMANAGARLPRVGFAAH